MKPPNENPSAADWARLNAHLAKWLTPQERKAAIGQTPNGRNRNTISNDLIGWLKAR